MDLQTIDQQLDELQQRYIEWDIPNKEARKKMLQVNRDGYTFEEYQRELEAIRQKQFAIYDPFEAARSFLDELCAFYQIATPDEQEAIRTMTDQKKVSVVLLLAYIQKCSARLQSPQDQATFRLGLAAASIENCSSDYRDVLMALADLVYAAESVGIDIQPHLDAVAALSSPEKPRGGVTPMRDLLANFQNYSVLKERRGLGSPGVPYLSLVSSTSSAKSNAAKQPPKKTSETTTPPRAAEPLENESKRFLQALAFLLILLAIISLIFILIGIVAQAGG